VRSSVLALLSGVAAAALLGLSACAATSTTATLKVKVEVIDTLRRYEYAYPLQAGDQLDIVLYRQPEFSRKTTVRPDGMIALPLVGEVKVVGKTPSALSEDLTRLYATRLLKPEVTVVVENPPEPMVYVVGSVGAPHAVPLRQARTVVQALAMSGDATHAASAENISVLRINQDGFLESRSIGLEKNYFPSQPEIYMALSNITLQSNDVVLVPESDRSQIFRGLQDLSVALSPLTNILILKSLNY